eukprot:TRINITY_DN14322_c0_g1_i1.p1 TRINITY_DN14322_c0_g1~~TRINITY_DN14322_c0_g1_i1.p1  ORF type:complete len:142 (-),score=39.13 TRINITY_DN14322_c0_g1_i1:62-487(-)
MCALRAGNLAAAEWLERKYNTSHHCDTAILYNACKHGKTDVIQWFVHNYPVTMRQASVFACALEHCLINEQLQAGDALLSLVQHKRGAMVETVLRRVGPVKPLVALWVTVHFWVSLEFEEPADPHVTAFAHRILPQGRKDL